ncbi:hypothetical protein [Komagataeibacter diospyri]|nr:hypothetical protein [Komagataeibacter diospyri]
MFDDTKQAVQGALRLPDYTPVFADGRTDGASAAVLSQEPWPLSG